MSIEAAFTTPLILPDYDEQSFSVTLRGALEFAGLEFRDGLRQLQNAA
jgi:hypothetical protein